MVQVSNKMRVPASYNDIDVMIPSGTGIYVPAEDTFLLLDLVAAFLQEDPGRPEYLTGRALDMGSGSGIVGLYLSKFFHEVHSVDVNHEAIHFQHLHRARHGVRRAFHPVIGSLASFLRHDTPVPGYFVACFNPPYLPGDGDEEPGLDRMDDMAGYALFSPRGGVAVLEAFLEGLPSRLDPFGHVFYITSSLMDVPEHDRWIAGLGYRQVGEARIHLFFEDIIAHHVVFASGMDCHEV